MLLNASLVMMLYRQFIDFLSKSCALSSNGLLSYTTGHFTQNYDLTGGPRSLLGIHPSYLKNYSSFGAPLNTGLISTSSVAAGDVSLSQRPRSGRTST